VRAQLAQSGAKAVIASRKNCTQPLDHEHEIYKHRSQVERRINWLKVYCGLATRFEKTAAAYLALVTLATSRMWLYLFTPAGTLRAGAKHTRPPANMSKQTKEEKTSLLLGAPKSLSMQRGSLLLV
jgi:hypothetical protein